jgi:hypothetical protein
MFSISNLSDLSSLATSVGVIFAAWQLLLSRQQAQTTFEDSMAKEYRELASTMPTKALLGEELTEAEHAEALDEFYHYFDLCNGQAFLRQIGRVRSQTWIFWSDGMRSHFKRPAFKTAWERISSKATGDFTELRLLMDDFQLDPKSRKWRRLIALQHTAAPTTIG